MAEIAPIDSAGTISAGIIANDSIPADSVQSGEELRAITLRSEQPAASPEATVSDVTGMSVVWSVLLLLFFLASLQLRRGKVVAATLRDLVDVRLRHNAFDDTAHETGFMLLLNILCAASSGVVLWMSLHVVTSFAGPADSLGLPALESSPALTIAVCCGVTSVYALVMWLAYWLVGRVFTDRDKTRLWVKGYGASQGVMGVWFLFIALPGLCYPQARPLLLTAAGAGLLICKSIFIYKGFRIFFTQISSWILFLYYLCSLEIIPLILALFAAMQLCSLL